MSDIDESFSRGNKGGHSSAAGQSLDDYGGGSLAPGARPARGRPEYAESGKENLGCREIDSFAQGEKPDMACADRGDTRNAEGNAGRQGIPRPAYRVIETLGHDRAGVQCRFTRMAQPAFLLIVPAGFSA